MTDAFDDLAFRVAELERRLANVVTIGTVAEVDAAAARVRVRVGDLLSDWRPWLAPRAAGVSVWSPPEVGEQVVLLCPWGDPALGLVLPALWQDAHPAPSASPNRTVVAFDDGTTVEYDRAGARLSVSCVGDVAVTASGAVTLDAPAISCAGGAGVITGESVCHFTGSPHADKSTVVTARK